MLKVIIVEDEEIIRKGLIASFDWEEHGCKVVADMEDGKKGLEAIRKLRPELVISDIRMPFMSGIEMIERARENHKFHTIFITSFADFEYARKGIELKVDGYLLKPIDEEELGRMIDEIEKESAGKKAPLVDTEKIGSNYYVEKTYEIIEKRYHEKLSIGEVCVSLKVSKSYLSRILKKNLNLSFVDILNQYRIEKADFLIGENKLKMYEISEQLGFCDYKHFCTVFKKYKGMSPREYVKREHSIGTDS